MEHLWAPWRMELIRKAKTEGCFFCRYIKETDDEKNLVIERGTHCFVVMNRYPYNNGHLMVVPYRHTGELVQLDAQIRGALMEYTMRWQILLAESMHAQGFNIGINVGKAGGAGVDEHLHIHIVPRWIGDTNYMAVVSDFRVINQALTELYQQLKSLALSKPQ